MSPAELTALWLGAAPHSAATRGAPPVRGLCRARGAHVARAPSSAPLAGWATQTTKLQLRQTSLDRTRKLYFQRCSQETNGKRFAMEQQASTSKVTVEYFDPHNVYELLKPGLIPRLPLHNLHWQSHSGPLRSIDTLHIELVDGGKPQQDEKPAPAKQSAASETKDDGFQTQAVGGQFEGKESNESQAATTKATAGRRHQIPGLRRTPYLKVLLVRCDDNDAYKNSIRSEVREWVKENTPPTSSSKKASNQENHDAYEWLILHVVIPNTTASTQPRSTGKTEGSTEKTTTSRWRTGSTPLLEKFRSDFNSSSKGAPDRIAQIRIGINDVPYDMLPRVVPAVPSGYSENEQDAERAWNELVTKFKNLILSSFDQRVTQYEEDIKEKDTQRTLPGWNFCTFFILKEGLAMGFENVGLIEDALVGYDELNVGLDLVLAEQAGTGEPESHGGAMLPFTEDLRKIARKVLNEASGSSNDDEAVDMQSANKPTIDVDDIPISPMKKAYRDMILANKVSVFDFRCYIFGRQIALLLRQANTSVTREQLLSRLKEQQESVLHGVAPLAKATPHKEDDTENLSVLAEVCRRTLEFVPSLSNVMRHDIITSLSADSPKSKEKEFSAEAHQVIDNLVSSFAFSIAQQILAQTTTKALPIPPSSLPPTEDAEQKASIPEPKTMMHPARNSSLNERSPRNPPQSPGFPGPGRASATPTGDDQNTPFLKVGIEELAAGRAELYMMSRSILQRLGKIRGWSTGWDEAPIVQDSGIEVMEEISLGDDGNDSNDNNSTDSEKKSSAATIPTGTGIRSQLLISATENSQDFYRLYEILTDKALRHYTVADQQSTVQTTIADLAVLKFFQKEYAAAKSYFDKALQFFGESGWSMIELSMLVMYLQCLSERSANLEYVRAALQLLTMSSAAELTRIQDPSARRLRPKQESEDSPIKGIVAKLCDLASGLRSDVRSPLSLFFTNIYLLGTPSYEDGRDGCSVDISIWSLLPDDITLEKVQLKVSGVDEGPIKDLTFDNKGAVVLKPGKNKLSVYTNSVIPGKYKVNHFGLHASRIFLHYDADVNTSQPTASTIFKQPEFTLFQHSNALDVELKAARHTSLDKNNSLDLSISTGWNALKRCEVRVKPSTGGLRLLTTDATVVDKVLELAKPPEAGLFQFNAMAADTSVTLRFPFSTELDLDDVFAKVEVTYVTDADESYHLAKTFSVPVSLAVGVNVQDVFKHASLFSRFNVTTATSGPLRLYKTELLDSELFSSTSGMAPAAPITIFPKQSASILYRVRRNNDARVATRAAKTMYLKLHYTQLHTEVGDLIRASVTAALKAASLGPFARAVVASLAKDLKKSLQPQDLERAALLGEVSTSFLHGIPWEKRLHGLAADSTVSSLASCLTTWQAKHKRLPLSNAKTPAADGEPSSILIPVEVPSLTIVHTADIRLQRPLPAAINDSNNPATPTVFLNQVLHATLRLKWTRIWDTESTRANDLEFSYDVSASSEAWLIGGRRKGHFVIPGSMDAGSGGGGASSTPETEAEIPLILIPQKEGWLPYPSVDIREVNVEPYRVDGAGSPAGHSIEVDWRNLGETVRVVSDKQALTVSLDASGPSGGPLVFESESRPKVEGTRIVA